MRTTVKFAMSCTLIVLFVFVHFCGSVKLPENFKKCNRKATNWKDCVLQAAQDGVPQLSRPFKNINLPSLNPLELLEFNLKAGAGTVAVDQYFKNCKIYGFDKVEFKNMEFNFDKKTFDFDGNFPELQLNCEYKLDGKVLLLPVKGEGDSKIILKNVKTIALLGYEETIRNNKTYMNFVSIDLDINPGFISFNFANLFNGDKILGDNINKVLNDNWREVFEDIKNDYVEGISQIVKGLLNQFFMKVSIEEAFD